MKTIIYHHVTPKQYGNLKKRFNVRDESKAGRMVMFKVPIPNMDLYIFKPERKVT